jgi:methionyl aminopeptidase
MTWPLSPVNLGDWRTRILPDRWTVVTADGALSAHFEHTICITDGAAEVFTRRGDELADLMSQKRRR